MEEISEGIKTGKKEMRWRHNQGQKKWVRSENTMENNAFCFGHVEIRVPELHSYFCFLGSLFGANPLALF